MKQKEILIFIISAVLFIPFLWGSHLFDWDEINFAESAREMIESNNFLTVQINFLPFWEKPPLFIWFQVLSMKIFGINEFAARFPNAICGILTSIVIFRIGKRFFNEKFGIFWVLTYLGSILPHFYFKSGIIDPFFNLFIFLGIYFFAAFSFDSKNKNISLSAFFIGLAILTKGPVALLIFGLVIFIFLIFKKFRVKISILNFLIFSLVLALTGGSWFIIEILNGNFDIVVDFFVYQIRLFQTHDAGHKGFLLYHFVVLLVGVFPASIFALNSFQKNDKDNSQQLDFKRLMLILFWTVLILFTVVQTKIVHYSSLCYFPLTFLGAYSLYYIENQTFRWRKIQSFLLLFIGIFIGITVILVSQIDNFKQKIIENQLIKDDFAVANLAADGKWLGFEFLIGLFLILGLIFYLRKRNFVNIFVITGVFTVLTILFLTSNIEKYSQHSAIEFYKSLRNQDCYVETLKFKSFAHLFYFEKKKSIPQSTEFLLTGNIEKLAYFVSKNIHKKEISEKYLELKILYEKNGFVFWKRDVKK